MSHTHLIKNVWLITPVLLMFALAIVILTYYPSNIRSGILFALDDVSEQSLMNRQSPHISSVSIIPGDARSVFIYNFLKKYNSPMLEHADLIVQKADEYGIDFRLTTAIAMCESELGKKIPKKDQFNPYGIAVYTDQTLGKAFRDWPHAIEWVSKHIRDAYVAYGITNPYDMEPSWAPPSANGNHTWAFCVNTFMHKIL